MWRQSYALIHGSAKAPADLWTVARDLWTLKLSTLLHRLDDQTNATSDEGSPSTSDHDLTSATESGLPQDRSERHVGLKLKLWDTISLVYLSALLVHYPISLSKIYKLIRSEEIPFIRASRFVPYEMISHLPSEYQLALDTITVPQRHELQKATFRFIQAFVADFGMEVPALNWKILLYEWIVELGLPLDVYSTVKCLAGLLDYNFAYQLAVKPLSNLEPEAEKRRPRRTPVAMPELQLISLVIVATKLLFPLPISDPSLIDRTTRTPTLQTSSSKPLSHPPNPLTDLSLDWQAWLALHKSNSTNEPTGPQKHIETSDKDVANMSPEEMDEYITWYQQTFVTPDQVLRQKKTNLEMSILDLFPVPEMSSPPQHEHVYSDTTRASLITQIQSLALSHNSTPHTDQSVSSVYPIFPSVEVLISTNELFDKPVESTTDNENSGAITNNPILFVHELAAKVACTDLKTLMRAVRYTEGKIESLIEKRRRARVFEGVSEEEENE